MAPSRLSVSPPGSPEDVTADVVIAGAGPAGLMLAANLARFGISALVLDDRPNRTSTGRADGLQPKTIETLKQMRLGDSLIRRGVRIYDICFWSSSAGQALRRTGREVHFPPVVDVLEPYILLVHQGMVEGVFEDDLESHGTTVQRSSTFEGYKEEGKGVRVQYRDAEGQARTVRASYLVGCDGAHSQVRKSMPGVVAEGSSSQSIWGVIDGVLDTEFPDIWSKVVLHSEEGGSLLCIPRERNMTRLYIELKAENGEPLTHAEATEEFVMDYARRAFRPFRLDWTSVEWFGVYKIGQRVASHFSNAARTVFIAGDASHTHSPKAAQGMNTSIHDSLNLAWKLNLAVRGLSTPELLSTYELERKKIAHDLINFDYEHANAFHAGDPEALARNFQTNIRFIAGVGVEYDANALNTAAVSDAMLQPGKLPPPARATRYMDANPVDLQLDVPMLGQFKVYAMVPSVRLSGAFLHSVSLRALGDTLLGRILSSGRESYTARPRAAAAMDSYDLPDRYTTISPILSFALLTGSVKEDFEIADLPAAWSKSPWMVYLDDGSESSLRKWMGPMDRDEIALVMVRPDGYVGAVGKWSLADELAGEQAGDWVEKYLTGVFRL